MTEKTIYIEPLQKRFKVEVKKTKKAKRNRSFSNASDCHGVRLIQKKLCSECNVEVNANESQRKIVKVGKTDYLLPAADLKKITEDLEAQDELIVHTVVATIPEDIQDRTDDVLLLAPVEKRLKEFAELAEIAKGRHFIGKGVFGGSEYEFILSTGNDGFVRLRLLAEQSQMYEPPQIVANVGVNAEVVQIENTILTRKEVPMYDFTKFKDTRAEVEERIIEDVVLNGKEVPTVARVETMQEENELERLKKLAGV